MKNFITKAGIPIAIGVSSIAVSSPDGNVSLFENLSDFDKVGVTFLISAEMLGTALIGYRFADGARTQIEKYGWQFAIPATNFAGMTLLLGHMWL